MADLSIYQNLGRGVPQVKPIGEVVQEGLNMRQLAMQNQQASDAFNDQRSVRAAFARNIGEDGQVDRQGVIADLARTAPMQAMDYQGKFAQMDQAQADAKQKVLADKINQMGLAAQMAMSAKDQPSYEAMLGQMKNMGLDTSHMPAQHDPGLMRQYALASLDQKQRLEAMAKTSEMDINQGKAPLEQGKLGAEIRHLNAETEKAANEKQPNQQQFAAATFGTRANQAENVFADLAQKGFDPTTVGSSFQRSGFFPERFKSEDVKRQTQAERNFVNAILRRESGAAISKDEFSNAEQQYFPRAGDPDDVLRQKEENRKTAIAALSAEGAPALPRIAKSMMGMSVGSSIPNRKQSGGKTSAGLPGDQNAYAGDFRKQGSRVSGDEVAQYATKHGMKESDARQYLKGLGYAVDK